MKKRGYTIFIKTFWAIFQKEMYHIFRDTRTLFILIGLPIALVLIFGYAVTNEFNDSKIAVLDQAKDNLSDELIQHITASGHFIIDENLSSINEIDASFKSGEVKMVVVIPPEFNDKFYKQKLATIQFIIDGTEPNFANTLNQYATRMIQRFSLLKNEKTTTPPFQIQIENRMVFNPELKSSYNFLPGVIAMILLLISAMMTSLTIAKEKETGTMEILLVSPVSPLLIILGKVGPYALLSFLNAVLILLMGYYIFQVPILGNLWLLLGMCGLYVLTALSLGILISAKSSSMKAAMMGSLMSLMMPTMLLSGFLFPITSMPTVLQYISKVIPATYFIEMIKGVMLKGVGLENLFMPTMILVVMTFFFLLVSLKFFKTRLE
jgi:ABC-2 type transport system permease protein